MAISLPSGCYWQTGEQYGLADSGRTRTFVAKGGYDDLDDLLDGLSKGDEIVDGWILVSGQLTRQPGDTGLLNLNCAPQDTTTDEDTEETSQKALSETWTLKSVRNDMSILGYCGTAAGNPSRAWIEAWQKEPDGVLAENYAFTQTDGTEFNIQDEEGSEDASTQLKAVATIDLIQKLMKGIDSVMRFYPLLTKTRIYTNPPETIYENLAEINTPTIGTEGTDADEVKTPGNLSTIISGHQWLKCQDDCSKTADGKFTRTEAWMGLPITDSNSSPWDANLYGPADGDDRWPVPYLHQNNA